MRGGEQVTNLCDTCHEASAGLSLGWNQGCVLRAAGIGRFHKEQGKGDPNC